MSLAIYRKYRPQKWSDLTDQNHIKVTLQNEISGNKIAHAYLFTGPRGIGKTTTARLFAKAINCVNRKEGQSEPCNKCDSCLELVGGNDLDILEIDAASHTGVDNVRENIIANARFTPVKRKYKVFIIDEVHMLSISAFNALLKILEEPPQYAIFILATTEVHKVPATIISRCQRFDFKKINSEDLIKRLVWLCQQEGIKVPKKIMTNIANVSEGCLRDAESLLGQVLSLGEKEIGEEEASLIIPSTNYNLVLELIDNLVYKNIEASINLINKLVDEGIDLIRFCDELIEILRKMVLSKIGEGLKAYSFDLDETTEIKIIELAKQFEIREIIKLINLFSNKRYEIKQAVLPQLPLEIAIIEYCSVSQDNNQPPPSQGSNSDSSSQIKEKNPPPKQEVNNDSPLVKKEAESSQGKNKGGANNTTLKNSSKAVLPEKNNLTLAQLIEKWHEFIVRMQEYNASLVFILKVAEPLELNNNVLKIGFKYAFHQQKVKQVKTQELLEQVLSEFFKEKLVVDTCLLDKDYVSNFISKQTIADEVELVDELTPGDQAAEQNQLIETLVKTFNGKVID